jgi:hypothetical protein
MRAMGDPEPMPTGEAEPAPERDVEQAPPGPEPGAVPPSRPAASSWGSADRTPRSLEVPGAPGRFFAPTITRVAALLVDSVLLAVFGGIVGGVIGGLGAVATNGASSDTAGSGLIELAAGLVGVSASYLYFTMLWGSSSKATVGQRVFRMQVGNAFDGATLSWRQATIRWFGLFGLSILTLLPVIGATAVILVSVWAVVLLVSTTASATRQGVHDRWAGSAVVATGPQNAGLAWGCLVVYVVGVVLLSVAVFGLALAGLSGGTG